MVLAQQARGLSIIEVDVQIHTWASTFLCKREINQLLKKYQELTKLCYMRVQPYVLLGHLYPVLSILSLIHIVLQIFFTETKLDFLYCEILSTNKSSPILLFTPAARGRRFPILQWLSSPLSHPMCSMVNVCTLSSLFLACQ